MTPVIVSASRETDLPCFFADWFLERLKEGWCAWKNMYSGTIHKVSFEKTRMIVFWSKNPRPLLRRLDEVEALGFRNYYFRFTLNDYEREGLEPKVAPLEERIDTFRELAGRIGKERVIWRFDPLMLGCAADTAVGPPVCGAAGTMPGPPVFLLRLSAEVTTSTRPRCQHHNRGRQVSNAFRLNRRYRLYHFSGLTSSIFQAQSCFRFREEEVEENWRNSDW